MKHSDLYKINNGNIFCDEIKITDYLNSKDVSFDTGFGESYSKPKSAGGRYLLRNQINSLGNIASLFNNMNKNGFAPVFNKEISDKIGGYPKGVILWNINDVDSYRVISLVDDNTFDYRVQGVDNIHWKVVNSISPLQEASIENINLLYSKTGTLPGVERLAQGITSRDGSLILRSNLVNFGDNVTPKNGPLWGNWLSLYVSDVDIRNQPQQICISQSRFILQKFGCIEVSGYSTPSFRQDILFAKKGTYWALWSNFSEYTYMPVRVDNSTWLGMLYADGDTNAFSRKFAGATFNGYINLYMG